MAGTIVEIPVHEGQSCQQRNGTAADGRFGPEGDRGATEIPGRSRACHARRTAGGTSQRNLRGLQGPDSVRQCTTEERARTNSRSRRLLIGWSPKSVSKYTLDDARNAVKVAAANLKVVQRKYELTKAGAWVYDIRNQEKTYQADEKAYLSSKSLLAWYTVRAPADGKILAIQAAVGSYVAPQGTYDTYTQGSDPVIVMGASEEYISVRCYIDEILIHRMAPGPQMQARMFIRGTNISVPLEYVRIQPYVSPKIELSDQRLERVDVRVLPVIFRFARPKNLAVYPGQLVDVYVAEK